MRDGFDDLPNGEADLKDMAKIVLKQVQGGSQNHSAILEVRYRAQRQPRTGDLFYRDDDSYPKLYFYNQRLGRWMTLIKTVEMSRRSRGTGISIELASSLVDGDIELYLDSAYGRHAGFDGNVTVTLTIKRGNTVISSDQAALRGAPVMFSHPMQTPKMFLSPLIFPRISSFGV